MVGTYFLEILPKIAIAQSLLGESTYLYFCIGFIVIHIIEKITLQRTKSDYQNRKNRILFEIGGFIIYQVMLGILIVFLTVSNESSLIDLVPFIFRVFSLGLFTAHIFELSERKDLRTITALSPLIGASISLILSNSLITIYRI
jgi:UDP-N-acetylmuramyl pentapeptide phosphotransferase/UDP-N-acetylglucosamine-1-phosphate transferase